MDTITEQDIAALGREAATHGDSTMDQTCQQALAGSEDAWQECADIIAATRREMALCDKCEEPVPEDEYLGNDRPDGTSEYLCPDCYETPNHQVTA